MKIRYVVVSPPIEGAIDYRAVHPDDAPYVLSTSQVFDEAIRALRGKHPGVPSFCKTDLDWREWVEDLIDTHPRRRDGKWQAEYKAAMDADKAIKAWVHKRYERPELVQVGRVGATTWPSLVSEPWVRKQK